MNLKSEWAGAKIPGLAVNLPKGVARDRGASNSQETDRGTQETSNGTDQEKVMSWQECLVGQGEAKRLRHSGQGEEKEIDTGNQEPTINTVKRVRMLEPLPGNIRRPNQDISWRY